MTYVRRWSETQQFERASTSQIKSFMHLSWSYLCTCMFLLIRKLVRSHFVLTSPLGAHRLTIMPPRAAAAGKSRKRGQGKVVAGALDAGTTEKCETVDLTSTPDANNSIVAKLGIKIMDSAPRSQPSNGGHEVRASDKALGNTEPSTLEATSTPCAATEDLLGLASNKNRLFPIERRTPKTQLATFLPISKLQLARCARRNAQSQMA